MNSLPFFIFFVALILTFFGISITAVIVWIKSFPKIKEILRDVHKHWSLRMFIYYGIFFSVFVIFCVFVSMVVGLGIFVWSINV